MGCAFNAASKLSNDDLRSMLKEHKNISNSEIPSQVKRSDKMEGLCTTSSKRPNVFGDRFSIVGHAIQSEIMYRILNDKF